MNEIDDLKRRLIELERKHSLLEKEHADLKRTTTQNTNDLERKWFDLKRDVATIPRHP